MATIDQWTILFLFFYALLITINCEDHDQPQQQPYCVSDGSNGVQCTATSSDNSTFNLNTALVAFKKNCTSAKNGLQTTCQNFENLFISSSSYLVVSKLSTDTDFAGLSFASVSVYPSVYLMDGFSCGKDNQLSKQLFVSSSFLQSSFVASVLASCSELRQLEVGLADWGTLPAGHQIEPCQLIANRAAKSPRLQYLTLRSSGVSIQMIKGYAFSCLFSRDLVALKLSSIQIKAVEVNAFAVRDQDSGNNPENTKLTINLDKCQLTEAVLKGVRLDRFGGRTVQLMLDNNLFETLPASLEGFLNSTSSNTVSLFGNIFNCKRQKSYRWLLANRELYKNRVWGAHCSSGEALLDLHLYEPKCSWNGKEFACLNINVEVDLHSEVYYLIEEKEENLQEIQLLTIKNISSLVAIPKNVIGLASDGFPSLRAVHLEDLPLLANLAYDAFRSPDLTKLTVVGVHRLPLEQILNLARLKSDLEELTMTVSSSSSLQSVPKSAFSRFNKRLQRVELLPSERQNRLLSITRWSFVEVSSSLNYLSFSGLAIAELETGAFDLQEQSEPTPSLELNLTGCSLDETKLRSKPFNSALRPLKIFLGSNSIRMLLKDSFSFLLLDKVAHQVDLKGNPIICGTSSNSPADPTDHHHYWLYVNRERLRAQITGARCSEDGSDLFEYLEKHFGKNGFSPNLSNVQLIFTSFLILVVIKFNM